MKKLIAIFSAVMVLMSIAIVPALADDDVTIPSGKTSKAGTTLTKSSATADPVLDIYEITPGSTIKFWIWRNGYSQVSSTYTFQVGNDLTIRYNNSGNMVQGAKYHSVWKKPHNQKVHQHIFTLRSFRD